MTVSFGMNRAKTSPTLNLCKLEADETFSIARDIRTALAGVPKRIPPRYFYDQEGSHLFQRITKLPEYYLTSCEYEILETHKRAISGLMSDDPFNLVELGAGDGHKTGVLLRHLLNQRRSFEYIPIDISASAMKALLQTIESEFAGLKVQGLVAEYFEGLQWLHQRKAQRTLVLFLGSNIGNFAPAEAQSFLRSLQGALNFGDLALIGFDLMKEIELLNRAYNDSQGVTRDFNLNLLRRINRELGGTFDLSQFQFYATFNPLSRAIESYLVSLMRQFVRIDKLSMTVEFEAWEPIHTESSYKYGLSEIASMASANGYSILTQLFDKRQYFVDSLWRVEKLPGDQESS